MFGPEQKSVDVLRDGICKLRKPENIVPDVCSETIVPGRAYQLLKPHRRFEGCEWDPNFVPEEIPVLAETFDRQFLNKDSDVTASKDDLSAAKTLVDGLDRIAAETPAYYWAVPKWFAAVQKSPERIMYFMSVY